MERFKYFNLVSKFNTMIEFYGRRARDRFEGKRLTYGYVRGDSDKKSAEPAQPQTGMPDRSSQPAQSHVIADVKKQSTTIRHMYNTWNNLIPKTGKSAPDFDFNKFKEMIQSKTDQLRKVKGCKAVRYRITMDKGKIRIKAKPIK